MRSSPIRPAPRTLGTCFRLILRKSMILQSVIMCPNCHTSRAETMPSDACQFFYECTGCGVRLKPKQGDCCVFCSYGSLPCPPIQAEQSDDSGAASCCSG